MDDEFDDLDRTIERIGADDAKLSAHRIERLGRPRERSRMRQSGLPARLRLPELDGDDRLAGRAREAAGGREPRDVGERLHIDDDDFEFRFAGKKSDVIGDRQAGLVAARDQILDRYPAFLERSVDVDDDAAALA